MHTKHHVLFLYTIGKNQLGICTSEASQSSSTGTCSQTKQLQGKPKRFQRRHGNVGFYETWNQRWWCKGNRSGPPKCSKKFQVGCALFFLSSFSLPTFFARNDLFSSGDIPWSHGALTTAGRFSMGFPQLVCWEVGKCWSFIPTTRCLTYTNYLKIQIFRQQK